jgi:hypothetical protein
LEKYKTSTRHSESHGGGGWGVARVLDSHFFTFLYSLYQNQIMPTNGDTLPTHFHGQNGKKGPKMAKKGPKMAQIWSKLKMSHNSVNFHPTVYFKSL